MPVYQIKDPNTGKTLKVTSNRQPTQEEALDIFAQQIIEPQTLELQEPQELTEEPEKLTEENIIKNPMWINAAKSVYKMNEGEDSPDLDSDQEYANYALRYMGWFNYNLPKMGLEAAQLNTATDEQRKDFVTLMDMYDEKAPSLAGFGRAATGLLSDPSTYLGIGTFGAATAGTQAIKQGIKEGVKQATKAGLKQGAKIGAIEASAYTAADNALRQSARIQAGQQENFDFGQSAKAATIGAVAGGTLGGAVGAIGSRRVANKLQEIETEDALKQTTDIEKPSIIDLETTVEQAKKEIQPEIQPFSKALGEEARGKVGIVTEDIQPELTVGLNKKTVDTAVDILNELNIPRDPNVQISDQILDAIQLSKTSPEYRNVFSDVLKRNNIDLLEFSQFLKINASDAGKKLARFSVAERRLKEIGEEISGITPKDSWGAATVKGLRDLDNTRRGLLVSQIATSMRNFTAQIGRVGVNTLTDIMDNTLNSTFNPMRRLFGTEEVPVDYNQSFGLLMNLTRDKKFAKDATDFVTKYFVKEKDRLFTNYASEVADATKAKKFKTAQKITDGLNTLNRMQEYYYRRGMFAATLDKTLKKKGVSLKEAVENNDMSKITQDDVSKAVDESLAFTYAKDPENSFGKAFVNFANSVPFVTTAVFPFARFMTNAMEFQFKHSPLGPLSLLTSKERAKVAAGDMGVFSKSMLGSALLMGAIEAKREGYGGEKWYELKGTDGTTIDARPYFPLTPYLLVADFVVRSEQGRIPPDAKDIIQGLSGAQFRGGTGLALVDNIINDISGIDSEEKINKAIARFGSDVLGGFLTPVRMFNDFIDQKQTFRTTQPTGEIVPDIAQQLQRSIPIAQEQLPELESPTREAAPGRPETVRLPFSDIELPGPLTRQLTGVTVRQQKNIAEKEIDRLGLKRRDILPYTGNAQADQLLAKYMGPVVENVVSRAVISPKYQSLDNPNKELVMREILKEIRRETKPFAQAEDPERFAKIQYNRLSKNIRKIVERIE